MGCLAMPDREKIRAEVEREFAELDAAEAAVAGLPDLLRAYGGYESAVHQAEQYFAALYPTNPVAVTTQVTEE